MEDLSRYAKRNHIEIQTKYLSFLMVVSIALVGLVFALGVLVGSRRSGEQRCPKVDALSVLDSRSEDPDPPPTLESTDFSFHDTLKRSRPKVPIPASLIGEDVPLHKDKPAVKGSEKVDVIPRMEETPIPESVPQDEPGTYSLQVGSFQEKRDANELVKKLQQAGYGAFLVSVNMPDRGGIWYRVRVGPFDSKKEVWDQKREFEQKEQIPAFIVKKRTS
jgi:cell division septation protein DedD